MRKEASGIIGMESLQSLNFIASLKVWDFFLSLDSKALNSEHQP